MHGLFPVSADFFLSTIPFCWGVSTQDVIPQKGLKFMVHVFTIVVSSKNFNPFIKLIFNHFTKELKFSQISFLDFSKYNQVARDLSSMKVTKYLKPSLDSIGVFPHKSEWIRSNTSLDLSECLGKGYLWSLAN
jgi:hypothetical protein